MTVQDIYYTRYFRTPSSEGSPHDHLPASPDSHSVVDKETAKKTNDFGKTQSPGGHGTPLAEMLERLPPLSPGIVTLGANIPDLEGAEFSYTPGQESPKIFPSPPQSVDDQGARSPNFAMFTVGKTDQLFRFRIADALSPIEDAQDEKKPHSPVIDRSSLSEGLGPDETPQCCIPVQCGIEPSLLRSHLLKHPPEMSAWQRGAAHFERELQAWMQNAAESGFIVDEEEGEMQFPLRDYMLLIGLLFQSANIINLNDIEIMAGAYAYINRLVSNDKIILTKSNVVQLTAVSFRLSMKYLLDKGVKPSAFASGCGFSPKQFNEMERSFCLLLEHEFFITEAEYQNALDKTGNRPS